MGTEAPPHIPSARATRSARARLFRRGGRATGVRVAYWPRPNLRTPLVAGVLFFGTILTTILIGMRYMDAFRSGHSPLTTVDDILPYRWAFSHLNLIAGGVPFALTLICILLTYELAHFYACRYFHVSAALPLLLPAPVLSGTLGASTRFESRVGSRTALMAIAAAGPVAGFAIACATTCYGLIHSSPMSSGAAPSLLHISAPLLFKLLRRTLLASYPDIPPLFQMSPHPVLLASWIGLVIIASNLIPAGQLGGGRIVYALSPRLHRITSTVAIGVLLYLGTVEWIGWLVWVAVILLAGIRLPKTAEQTDVGAEFLALVPVAIAIFMLTASTQPVIGMSLVQLFLGIHWGL